MLEAMMIFLLFSTDVDVEDDYSEIRIVAACETNVIAGYGYAFNDGTVAKVIMDCAP